MDHPDLERLRGPDRRISGLELVVVILLLPLLAGMFLLRPQGGLETDLAQLGVTDRVYQAEVEAVDSMSCSYSPDEECLNVTFRLTEGPTPEGIATQEFPLIPSTPEFTEGEPVMLNYLPDAPPSLQYQFADRDRRPLLIWVAIAFALSVVALGRLRGLAALGGLGASVFVLIWFIVPSILEGRNPVLVATVGAGIIAYLALYMAHGWKPLTHVALLGTFSSLVLTVGLSALTVTVARFSGLAGEESLYLTLIGDIDVRGLLLAGIVLGALGALDDVTVTQASAVWELHRAGLGRADLFKSGIRVGRDHIASTVNTLLLAYAGASMPLLLLFALSRQSLGVVANSEVIAVEITRTLVGSIGLVAAVPITTWLAAGTASRSPGEADAG